MDSIKELLTEEVRLDIYKKTLGDFLSYRLDENRDKFIGICHRIKKNIPKEIVGDKLILFSVDLLEIFTEFYSRQPDITIGGYWFPPEKIEPRITLLLEIIQELEQKLQIKN